MIVRVARPPATVYHRLHHRDYPVCSIPTMHDLGGATRSFNTAGPMDPDDHYCIPPLSRMKQGELLALIRKKRYFVLHAPRQTGKTSALLALRDLLNGGAEGAYRCVYANVEAGQASRENTERAMRSILGELEYRARTALGDESLAGLWPGVLDTFGPDGALQEVLARWAEASPTPLVLLIDEIDALIGDTLLSVLRQLRARYDERPAGFPQSVILCGVRDVRDYRIRSTRQNAIVTGGSAFQRQGQVTAFGRFLRIRGARVTKPAHRRDRPAMDCGGVGSGVGADAGAAVAGERTR